MKFLKIMFVAVLTLIVFAAPVLATTDLQTSFQNLFGGTIDGLLKIIGMIVLAFATKWIHSITKKIGVDSWNDKIDQAITQAINYSEERARKRLNEGLVVTGAEKFAVAYGKAAEKLPFLDQEEVKEFIVSKLAQLRTLGLEKAEAAVEKKLPSGA